MNAKFEVTLTQLIVVCAALAGCAPQSNTSAERASNSDRDRQRVVVVAGATGRTGQHVVKALLDEGVSVRAISRSKKKADDLFGDAVSVYEGDVTEPASLSAAFSGATAVISAIGATAPAGPNSPEFVDYGGTKNLIDAAVAAGVEHFVLVSSLGASHPNHPLNAAFGNVMTWKLKGEDSLRASGLDYTIVRPGGLSDAAARQSALLFDQGDTLKTGRISRADVAEVCVAALDAAAARNTTFEVIGEPGETGRDWGSLFGGLKRD